MRANIHPNWYQDAKVICACGNVFTTGSTVPEIRVDICSNCHPFFTGQAKLVDTLGQVEKFTKAKEASKVKQAERAEILKSRVDKVKVAREEKPTLKDLLMRARKKAVS